MSEVARTIKGRPYERDVAHAVYDDTLMLRSVFGYTTKVRLDDVIPVQVRHLAVGLYPYLPQPINGPPWKNEKQSRPCIWRIWRGNRAH
jgi:hypothetical protein